MTETRRSSFHVLPHNGSVLIPSLLGGPCIEPLPHRCSGQTEYGGYHEQPPDLSIHPEFTVAQSASLLDGKESPYPPLWFRQADPPCTPKGPTARGRVASEHEDVATEGTVRLSVSGKRERADETAPQAVAQVTDHSTHETRRHGIMMLHYRNATAFNHNRQGQHPPGC
jgi:hypothetical protein